MKFKLTAPKMVTFGIAVIVAIIALVSQVAIAAWAPFAFWLLLVAFIVLALGNFITGM